MRRTSWAECTLGDLITLQRGYDITKKEQRDGPFPVVSSSGPNSSHDAFTDTGPGVVIGRKGTLGTAFYINGPFWAHDTTLWVRDFKGNDKKFIFYLLQSMKLASYDVGSSNPTLNRNHLHLLPVRAPDVNYQRRIANALSVYDDLIEVNRRRIAILEEMARRLFDEWFVRFRFPGHEAVEMVETESGLVPKGWLLRTLSWWVKEIRDGVLPKDVDAACPYIGLEHLPRRSTTLIEAGGVADVSSAKLKFQAGDILFGKIRPYFHKVAYMPFDGVCSTDAICIRPKNRGQAAFILGLVSSDAFVANAVATSNGTKMPRADWKVLQSYPLPEPPEAILKSYLKIATPMLENASVLATQNNRLRTARDILLPKLVSGEIDVGKAEEAFAEAAE